jgi:hypothetical protein
MLVAAAATTTISHFFKAPAGRHVKNDHLPKLGTLQERKFLEFLLMLCGMVVLNKEGPNRD